MNRRLLLLAASAIAGICFAAHSAAQNPPSTAAPVTPVSTITKVDPGATPLPSTNELLQKFETVSGGRSVWSGFTTRYMKGIYQTEDASGFAAIEVFSKSPNKTLFKIAFPNGVVIREVCDGRAAWIEDSSGGTHMISGAALESRIRQANFNDRADALLMAITGRVLGTEKVGAHGLFWNSHRRGNLLRRFILTRRAVSRFASTTRNTARTATTKWKPTWTTTGPLTGLTSRSACGTSKREMCLRSG